MTDWIGFGIHNPDNVRWFDFIEVVEVEQHLWNKNTEEWETDEEYDSDEEDWKEMNDYEMRARESVKLHKRPFDKRERELRKENPDMPDWAVRTWYYVSTVDETREKQIETLEKSVKKQALEKKRKKSREKLFKRLNSTKRFKRR